MKYVITDGHETIFVIPLDKTDMVRKRKDLYHMISIKLIGEEKYSYHLIWDSKIKRDENFSKIEQALITRHSYKQNLSFKEKLEDLQVNIDQVLEEPHD